MATRRSSAARRQRQRALVAAVAVLGLGTVVAAVALGAGLGPARSSADPGQGVGAPVEDGAAQVHYHPGRPTHIYDGSCARLGEVAYALNPVGSGEMTGPAMEGVVAMPVGETVGARTAVPVEIGQIKLDAPLAEIVAAPRAINVQISEYEYGTFIACGDLGGGPTGETLALGLRELHGSGYAGVAVLRGADDGTVVTVYLTEGGSGAAGAVAAAAGS